MATFPAKTNYLSGDVLTAAQMVDIGDQLNALNKGAGKNKIINGDFRINQRSFSSTTTNNTYGFDRWASLQSDGTVTYSAQTFTLGTAPVAGYEGTNFARIVTTGQTAASARANLVQRIESVRTLANQTVNISFWAKAASGTPKVAIELQQSFGTGGSPSAAVNTYFGQATLSTDWQRFSFTAALPSIAGKTFGTVGDDNLTLLLWASAGSDFNSRTGSLGIQSNTFDFWGVQVEAGSVATAFQTATGTLAGELHAAQRYYQRFTCGGAAGRLVMGMNDATTTSALMMNLPVTMRSTPPTLDFGNVQITEPGNNNFALTGLTVSSLSTNTQMHLAATGLTGLTLYRPCYLTGTGSTSYIAFSAEL